LIKNKDILIGNSKDEVLRRLRHDACAILDNALSAVDPKEAVLNALSLNGDLLSYEGGSVDLSKTKKIIVVGGGKAGGLMVKAVEVLLGGRITSGLVNVLKGSEDSMKTGRVALKGASHPIPGNEGIRGVDGMLDLTNGLTKNDLVITLISGGGSALMPYPVSGITLKDIQELTSILLKAGANINELNVVRKHISGFKGGQFARHACPARMISLILSDVIGDPLDTIASGPTSPDESTFTEARDVLVRYGLLDTVPENVLSRINGGMNGIYPETPKPTDPIFENVSNLVIANNYMAASAAFSVSEGLGYNSMILSTHIEGEARHVGKMLAGIVREENSRGLPIPTPAAIIVGGETTVTVKGEGKGGRNQEVALGAIHKMNGLRGVIATFGTDGIDGPTDAAGAIVDGKSLHRALELGLNPKEFLEGNDSYSFFKSMKDLIITGPTGTNVNDLTVLLVR
jgi:glycerate-2-kinase